MNLWNVRHETGASCGLLAGGRVWSRPSAQARHELWARAPWARPSCARTTRSRSENPQNSRTTELIRTHESSELWIEHKTTSPSQKNEGSGVASRYKAPAYTKTQCVCIFVGLRIEKNLFEELEKLHIYASHGRVFAPKDNLARIIRQAVQSNTLWS